LKNGSGIEDSEYSIIIEDKERMILLYAGIYESLYN
jgi:hypothetical protein